MWPGWDAAVLRTTTETGQKEGKNSVEWPTRPATPSLRFLGPAYALPKEASRLGKNRVLPEKECRAGTPASEHDNGRGRPLGAAGTPPARFLVFLDYLVY